MRIIISAMASPRLPATSLPYEVVMPDTVRGMKESGREQHATRGANAQACHGVSQLLDVQAGTPNRRRDREPSKKQTPGTPEPGRVGGWKHPCSDTGQRRERCTFTLAHCKTSVDGSAHPYRMRGCIDSRAHIQANLRTAHRRITCSGVCACTSGHPCACAGICAHVRSYDITQ